MEHQHLIPCTFLTACCLGNEDMINYLLKNNLVTVDTRVAIYGNLDPMLKKIKNEHALVLAAYFGQYSVFKRFWDLEDSLVTKETRQRAIDKAVSHGHLNIVDHFHVYGVSFLDAAIKSGKKEMVMKFIDYSEPASVIMAMRRGHSDIAAMLLRKIPVNAHNEILRTAITIGDLHILEILLAKHNGSMSSLRNAVSSGQLKVVERLLLFQHLRPELDMLDISIMCGHLDILKCLITRAKPFRWETLLHIAVKSGHKDIVKYLLDDPRTDPAANGYLALNTAFRLNFMDIVALLCVDPRMNPDELKTICIGNVLIEQWHSA